MNSLQPSSAIPRLDVDPFGSDFLSDPYVYHDLLRDAGRCSGWNVMASMAPPA